MAVDVKDLPPAYQVQALRKWEEQERRRKRPTLPCPDSGGPEKKTKYHNVPAKRVTDSGAILRFDSQKEARRYDHLAALERAGQIRDLRLQVDFTLQEAYTDTEGRRVRAIRYRADFTYQAPAAYWTGKGPMWDLVVEDVKSRPTRTKEYLLKRKLLKDKLGIDITEV